MYVISMYDLERSGQMGIVAALMLCQCHPWWFGPKNHLLLHQIIHPIALPKLSPVGAPKSPNVAAPRSPTVAASTSSI